MRPLNLTRGVASASLQKSYVPPRKFSGMSEKAGIRSEIPLMVYLHNFPNSLCERMFCVLVSHGATQA